MSQATSKTTSVVPIGGVATLTGNSGGAVGPTAGNIDIVGSGIITVTGNPGTSTLTITSSAAPAYLVYTAVTTSPYVVAAMDDYLGVDSSSIAITVQLPNTTTTGRVVNIKDSKGSSAIRNITVTTVGGIVLIDGATSYVMNTAYEAINVIWNGSSYEIF